MSIDVDRLVGRAVSAVREALEDDLRAANAELAELSAEVPGLEAEVARLNTEVARLTALLEERPNPEPDPEPDPDPEPPTRTTVFGACATSGSSPSSVVTKWGQGAAVRIFQEGAFKAFTRPPGASVVHISAKPATGTPLTEAAVRSWIAPLQAGDIAEIWHELDVKFRDGKMTQAQVDAAIERKNEFYAIVKRIRPDVLVGTTYAAWMFASAALFRSANADGAQYYSKVDADVVGIDCDGIKNLERYPDFSAAVTNVIKYIQATQKYKHWTVPEFVHPRLDGQNGEAALDRDGAKRAAWAKDHGEEFRSATPPAYAAMLFDTNANAVSGRQGQPFAAGSPEFDAWKALVSGKAA